MGEYFEIQTLGNKIKNRRKELCMTLRELAGDRVTPAQLSYVETDKCKPSLDLLEYISVRLGLKMDYLLESEEQQVSKHCEFNIKVSLLECRNGCLDSALKRLDKTIELSSTYGLNSLNGEAELNLGTIYSLSNDSKSAVCHFLNALYKFSMADDYRGIVRAYIKIGQNHYDRRSFDTSLQYFKQAESYLDKLNDMDIVIKLIINYYLSALSALRSDMENTALYAKDAYICLESLYNPCTLDGTMLRNTANPGNEYEYHKGLQNIDDIFRAAVYGMDLKLLARMGTKLGIIFSICGMIEDSERCLYRSKYIEYAINDSALPLTLIADGCNLIENREFDKALLTFEDALNLSMDSENRKLEYFAYYNLFRLFERKGDLLKAEECIRKCVDIMKESDNSKGLAYCCLELGQFYRRINREKEAYFYLKEALTNYKRTAVLEAMQ